MYGLISLQLRIPCSGAIVIDMAGSHRSGSRYVVVVVVVGVVYPLSAVDVLC